MATPENSRTVADEKVTMNQLENIETHDELKTHPKYEKVDAFGAHAKTDPKEIALVKKIDRYILASRLLSYKKTVANPDCSLFSG